MDNRQINLVLFVVGLLMAVCAAVVVMAAVSRFNAVFETTDAAIPWLSRAVLDFYPAIFLVPIAIPVIWFTWPNRRRRGVACLVGGACGACLGVLLGVVALYLPIQGLTASL